MSNSDQRTALFDRHKALGAKIIPFGGWAMPVSYEGVLKEHHRVRHACGLFDVSHMGEIFVRGVDAESFLQYATINDVTRLADGQGQYTAICNERGGMLDDLFVYRLAATEFLICANASNIDKDFAWLKKNASDFEGLELSNQSDLWSQLAVQGPNTLAAVQSLVDQPTFEILQAMRFTDIKRIQLSGQQALIARTGYTGEFGFEIYLPNSIAGQTWDTLLATAPKTDIAPIGLGARDTLRLEPCYLLYGNDMDESVTPIEAGIGWAVRLDAGAFIGRDVIARHKESGPPRKNVAFTMEEGIPRHGMKVFVADQEVGEVTSGSVLPSVGGAGGMALLKADFANVDADIYIDVRGKRKLARIQKKPLYKARAKD